MHPAVGVSFLILEFIMRLALCAAFAATAFGLASANAADLPAKGRSYTAPAVVYVPTWTGWYIGLIGGYGTGPVHGTPTGVLDDLGAYPVKFTADGGFVGGQLGYDYQYANGMVLGAVADIAWANLKGDVCADISHSCSGSNATFAIGTVEWLATFRARLGTTIGPNTLLYATGGLALGGVESKITKIDAVHDVSDTNTHVGWTIGAGGEFKLTQQISLGLEYLYVDLGKEDNKFSGADMGVPGAITSETEVKQHLIKGALNYRF